MKLNFSQLAIVFLFFAVTVKGQDPINITGTKFTYPLISKWITEYTRENPSVKIVLVNKTAEVKIIDISIIAHQPSKTDLLESQQLTFVSKFALLPIAGKSNAFLKNNKGRELDKKELDKLFFEEGLLEDKREKSKNPVNVYTRENQACSSIAFADYFGHLSSELRGKKIAGDDIYLLSSIKKDSIGITFNNLGYVYDITTRQLKDGITVLPLHLKKEVTASLKNIDDAIVTLEREKIETIPVEKIGLIYSNNIGNKEIVKFLKWIVTDGQKYNHEYGFLNLDKDLQARENEKLAETLVVVK